MRDAQLRGVDDPGWARHLRQIEPVSAGLAVLTTTGDRVIGSWQGLGELPFRPCG